MNNDFITPNPNLLPDNCTVRAGQLSDYLLAFKLFNDYYQEINGIQDIDDPEIIRIDWLNDGFNPETDIHTVFGADGRLLGLVEVWMTGKPPVHPFVRVCVHPDYREKGIWEYLLQWGEVRSRAALDLTPADLRIAVVTGAQNHDHASIRTIEKLGWSLLRSFYRMAIDFDIRPDVPELPAGIIIRPYDPATETVAVYNTLIDSFRDHFGYVEQPFEHGFAEFKHNLIDVPGFDPATWFVAMDGDQMAGICLCRAVDMEDNQSGWVNDLGVRRSWRKQGLGYAMLKHAFADFYARGQKRAALGVDASSLTGALRLYERAGMHVVRQFDQYEKELRPGKEIATHNLE
jgi:GNAT superfamily N-acetyltransferase